MLPSLSYGQYQTTNREKKLHHKTEQVKVNHNAWVFLPSLPLYLFIMYSKSFQRVQK